MQNKHSRRDLLPMANGAVIALLVIELAAVLALSFNDLIARILALIIAMNGSAIIVVVAALGISGIAANLQRRRRRQAPASAASYRYRS